MKNNAKLEEKWHKEYERKYRWVFRLIIYPHSYIKYDYTLPDPNLITDWVNDAINDMKVSNKTKERIKKEIDGRNPWDDYSKISLFMQSESLFGKEWFFGYGTLYRWRNGEEDNALRMFNYLSVKDEKLICQLQNMLREKVEKYYNGLKG
jgi:hypothetical protein